jgi:protein-L-isoaspartate(D-aspartate) O-methyltransferase
MDPAQALAEALRESIADERVLAAITTVPRGRFVPAADQARAYENVALPIACGQTISQPVIVGRMLELLELTPADRVLDVGTGSGYHAALLAQLVAHVWTVERHAELTLRAQATLAELGISNVTCLTGDGAVGLAAQAPFDAINVAAATGSAIPPELVAQLADGGRLVAPVGDDNQRLIRLRRRGAAIQRERLDKVRFVPLVRGSPPRETPGRAGAESPRQPPGCGR